MLKYKFIFSQIPVPFFDLRLVTKASLGLNTLAMSGLNLCLAPEVWFFLT